MERIESNPASFDELECVPPEIAVRDDVCVRKAKITGQNFDFRLLFFHWKRIGLAEIFEAFPRKKDYGIDWEWACSHVSDQS